MADNLSDMRLDLGLLKKDVASINGIFNKLDDTIDKLQELTMTMTRMISVHEHRLELQEKADDDLNKLIELRRTELQMDIKELHSRITTINRELTDKIDESEEKLMNEMKALKECILKTRELQQVKDQKSPMESLMDRVSNIESWKWKMTGAFLVVVWLLNNVNLVELVKLFK